MNRANEVMNLAFRQGRIGYNDIFRNIERTMDRVPFEAAPTFETYIATDAEAQRVAEDLI